MRDEQRSTLATFFAHPAVGIAGSVASVVGLLAAVYFYFAAQAAPELTTFVHPVRTTVVKAGQVSALTVSLNGKELRSDVTAAQIAFWNAGNQAIRPADILEPFRIITPVPMLEVTIRRKSREVLKIDLDRTRLYRGEVGVSWNILEDGDGAVLQMIYAGDTEIPIQSRGTVVGQGAVVQESAHIKSPSEQYKADKRIAFGLAAAMIAMGIVLFAGFYFFGPPRLSWFRWTSIFVILYASAFIILGILIIIIIPEGPPFAF
jgi:hypothetical protein